MKIYIAKHYWKDGENATWECHKKVDKLLFEYLKENYHKFVSNKPEMIEQNNRYVYLCYEEGKDTYGRNITNITFFISKKKVDINVCKASDNNMELEIGSSSDKLPLPLIISVAVMASILSLYLLLSNDNNEKKIETEGKGEEIISISNEKVEKQSSRIELRKNEKDIFNQKISKIIINTPKNIDSHQDFLDLQKNIKILKQKESNALMSTQNKRRIKIRKELFGQYRDILISGIKVRIKIATPKKDRRKYKLFKVAFNEQYCKEEKDKFWSCDIKNGDDIHIVLQKKALFKDSRILDKKNFIDENFLIAIYNGTINRNSTTKIHDGYSIQIEKIEGKEN